MISRRGRIALRWAVLFAILAMASAALLAWYGVALVDAALKGAPEQAARRVVSAPLALRRGDPWTAAQLAASMSARGLTASSDREPGAAEFLPRRDGVTLGPGIVLESPGPVFARTGSGGLGLTTAAGASMSAASVRPTVIGTTTVDGVVRWDVPIDRMAPHLLTAVVDTEDQTFLSHQGLSARGLVRAAISDLVAGGVRQGGSTITQQLAKILMLRPSRTVGRKVLEAWLAALIEYRYDKRTILEAYLNRIYLGQDGSRQLQGVEAASTYYFGKRAGELREDEAALLAGLIAAPNRFDPFAHPDAARRRRTIVLQAMVRQGHLDAEAARNLDTRPLPARPWSLRWPPASQVVEAAVATSGASGDVHTTIDIDVQSAAMAGVRAGVRTLEHRSSQLRRLAAAGDPLQAAVVVVALDGRILALVGSRDGQAGEFNRAMVARRQIGSLVKPFVAVEALAAGRSLDDPVLDEPLTVVSAGGPWRPRNSDGRFRGEVTLRRALVESLNVPMVRVGLDVSVGRVAAALQRVGLAVGAPTPAILLGAVEATPIEVARAFAALKNEGRLPQPTLTWPAATGTGLPVLDPAASREVLDVMTEVVRSGTAAGLGRSYAGRLAAKTGTSDDRRDSWFVAVRSTTVAAVWLGTDGNRETGLFGATGAMEVWRAIDERLPEVWRR